MAVKHRNYEYSYAGDPRENRSDEFILVKRTVLCLIVAYLLSSIGIFFFIDYQAAWERRANIEDAPAVAAADTWKWFMWFGVLISDFFAFYMLQTIWKEKPKKSYPILATISIAYSIFAICNVFLRGSIVAFVFPFAIGTYLMILWYLQLKEDEEHEITQGLRLRDTGMMYYCN